MAATRGGLTEAVKSAIGESEMVEMPLASISRCTSPTDQQQKGQTGTRRTASTFSACKWRIMAGTLSSNKTCGRRI